jgi:hypothetical protein
MPDTPGTEVGQAPEAQAPAVETPTTAQAPEAQGVGSGPWATKLAATFADESTRSQVDAFLRSEVQPYTTRLEQQLATGRDAMKLWQDLQEAPAETYLSLTSELFGEDAVDQVIELLASDDDEPTPPPADQPARDPEVEELLNERRQTKAKQAYDAELARVKAERTVDNDGKRVPAPGEVEVIDDLFHPFVHAAEGDFNAAYEGYKQYYAQFKAQFAPAETPSPAPQPPNTLGSDTAVAPAPPTQRTHQSIDDALDDIFDTMRSAPPVMGGV